MTLSPYSLTDRVDKALSPSACRPANYTDAAYVLIKHLLNTFAELHLKSFTFTRNKQEFMEIFVEFKNELAEQPNVSKRFFMKMVVNVPYEYI